MTDSDGSEATGTLNVTFDDDGPNAEAAALIDNEISPTAGTTLDESPLPADGGDGVNPATIAAADIEALFTALTVKVM